MKEHHMIAIGFAGILGIGCTPTFAGFFLRGTVAAFACWAGLVDLETAQSFVKMK